MELPRDEVVDGRARGLRGARRGRCEFSRAILTSDAGPKRACLEVALPAGTVRLAAQAKGAGMISPRHATMFCFIQTDAALDADTLDLLTGVCVKRSFDRISVDGQLSTSDTVVALANGASSVRVEPQSPTSSPSARPSTRCSASWPSRSSTTARVRAAWDESS